MRIDRVVTRGGDGGETSLADGTRLRKDSARIEAIGAVDETNAALGLLRLHLAGEEDAMIARIQNDLFDLGADLARPWDETDTTRLRIAPTHCARLEAEIIAMNAELPPLTSFVLPGGTPAAASTHLARTIARRAERTLTHLANADPINPTITQYLNRLSDHLFTLARVLNANGQLDTLWIPGAHR